MLKDLDELFIEPGQKTTDDGTHIVILVRQWADKEIIHKRLDYLENYASLFREKSAILGLSIGLQRLCIPEDLGGFGWNTPGHAADLLRIIQEIGRADASAGTLFAMSAACQIISAGKSSSADIRDKILGPYSGEALVQTSFILPGPGYDGIETPLFKGRSILARVEMSKDTALVQGKNLRPFAGGHNADLFCVVCADENGDPCLAVVPGDTQGLSRSRPFATTGLNACTNAEITLDKVRIPSSMVFTGTGTIENLYTWLNLLMGGVSLGAGLNFFEILSDWAETRVIKGSTQLKENPLCASVLADVAEELACSRLLLRDLSLLMTGTVKPGVPDERLFTYAGMIGSRVQQSIMKALNRGLELMGSAGYAKEWHAEKHWRDVKTIQSLLSGVASEAPVKMDSARFFYDCRTV